MVCVRLRACARVYLCYYIQLQCHMWIVIELYHLIVFRIDAILKHSYRFTVITHNFIIHISDSNYKSPTFMGLAWCRR